MPLSLGLRLGLSAGTSAFGWAPLADGYLPAFVRDGQQVALPAYGPELITTGTFDASTGWNIGSFADWSISGGTLNKTGTSASGGPTFTLASQLTAGKLYRITYQVVSVSVGGVGVRTSGSLFSTLTNRLSAGTYEEYVVPISGVTGIQVVASAAGVTCVVDNLSVREVRLGELGTNLGASGYTMSVAGGTATATESPTGTLNLTGDAANFANGDKSFTCVVGRHYRIIFLMTGVGTVFTNVGTSSGGTQNGQVAHLAAGVKFVEFTATATTHWLRFATNNASLHTISSITIAEWTPAPVLRSVPVLPTYGPELVTNGTFDTDLTGWGQFSNVALTTPTTGVTVSSGVASIARPGAPDVFLTQTVNVTQGRQYEFRFTKGGGSGNYSTQQTAPLSASATANTGTTTLYFTATGSTFVIAFWSAAGNTMTVDNVSVREVTSAGAFGNGSSLPGEAYAYTASSTTARTYVGQDGLIKNDLAADAPRFTWNSTRGKWELLLENQSTNLCLRSSDMPLGASLWEANNATLSTAATDAGNEITVTEDTGTTNKSVFNTGTSYTSGTTYTFSASFTYQTLRYVQITGPSAAFGTSQYATFDLLNGTVHNSTGGAARINRMADGRYRCEFTVVATSTTSGPGFAFALSDGSAARIPSYLGSSRTVKFCRPQCEAQAFASSYIPTEAATVTRLIETCRYSPLVEAMFQLPGASARVQGVLNVPTSASHTGRILGAASTHVLVSRTSGNVITTWNGSVAFNATLGSGLLDTGYGVATSYNSSGRALAGNGGAINSDTNQPASRSTVYLARAASVGANEYGDGRYYSDALWPFRVSNANLPTVAAVPT